MQVWPYYLVYILPISAIIGGLTGGIWAFLTPVIVFGLVPLADIFVGLNRVNPEERMESVLEKDMRFTRPTKIAAPIQIFLMFWGAWFVSRGEIALYDHIGLVLSVGISGGVIGINIAHELIHRPNKEEQFLGRSLLWTVAYLHWGIEHVAGHHRHVATLQDPATAKYGQSVYAFFVQTIIGSFKSAWEIERGMLSRKNKAAWSFSNRIIRYFFATILLLAALWWLGGRAAIFFFFAQSVVAILLLEIVNYIEHYGLLRKLDENGKPERVQPHHSWNAAQRLTNYFLFNLQRHSDHHAHPMRRYQILRHMDEAPQLPAGYAAMVLVALVPPLWFRMMNKRVPKEGNLQA